MRSRIKEAEKIENLANVTSVNRLGQQSAYLTDLSPVTASDSIEQGQSESQPAVF